MNKIFKYIMGVAAAFALVSCHYNPLDSYQRIPPDRGSEGGEEQGGLNGNFAAGYGTSDEPYTIKTAAHLMNMSKGLIEDEMVYFRLENDIDLSGKDWTPLNNKDPYNLFVDFDGNNHIIKGLKVEKQPYSSFFGILCGNCRNLGFIEADVNGDNASGIIAGYLGIRAPKSANYVGVVENCYVSGSVYGSPAGGISGYMGTAYNGGICRIENCYSAASVSGNGASGGVAGQMLNGSVINNVYAASSVSTSNTSSFAGGICGWMEGESSINGAVAWNEEIIASQKAVIAGSQKNKIENVLAWEGIKGVSSELTVSKKPELQAAITSWGEPWAADGAAANGFPALAWQVARGDVAQVCGLEQRADPEPEPEPGKPVAITAGSGTEADPYQITSFGNMLYIKELMVADQTVYFKLMNDVDMKNAGYFPPINPSDPYNLKIDFNGNNHKLLNFKSKNTTYASLFGVLVGKCYDLEFVDPVIVNSGTACGVVAGYLGAGPGPGFVENVKITGASVTVEATDGTPPVGMVCGIVSNSGSSIRNCTVDGNISNECINGDCAIGGIAGSVRSANAVIENCTTTGKTVKALTQVGGIAGNVTVASVTIKGCRSSMTLGATSWDAHIGGIAGYVNSDGCVIEGCRFDGKMDATSGRFAGGIVGTAGGSVTVQDCLCCSSVTAAQMAGGIVGDLKNKCKVLNCLFTGNCTAGRAQGGIAGRAADGGWNAQGGPYDITVKGCLVWDAKIDVLSNAKNHDGAGGGVIVGYTAKTNTLADCFRNSGVNFISAWTNVGLAVDQENADASNPLANGTSDTDQGTAQSQHIYPYHGKLTGGTASAKAAALGWSSFVWDLEGNVPELK